jgi:hypothetical protein
MKYVGADKEIARVKRQEANAFKGIYPGTRLWRCSRTKMIHRSRNPFYLSHAMHSLDTDAFMLLQLRRHL